MLELNVEHVIQVEMEVVRMLVVVMSVSVCLMVASFDSKPRSSVVLSEPRQVCRVVKFDLFDMPKQANITN